MTDQYRDPNLSRQPSGWGTPPPTPPSGWPPHDLPDGAWPPAPTLPGDLEPTRPLTPGWGVPPVTPPAGVGGSTPYGGAGAWGAAGTYASGTTPPPGTPGYGGASPWEMTSPYEPLDPQVGMAYGTRPPAPPPGLRRGGEGSGSRGTPPALIAGSVIAMAVVLAVAAWFLLLRPAESGTALASPTPTATLRLTAAPTGEPSFDDAALTPTPEPTRFRNPTFRGLKVNDAQLLASRNHVELDVTYEVTDEAEPDMVLSQDPLPGSAVLPGDTVLLTVAAPPPTVTVPDLRGFTEDDAVVTLLDADLLVGDRSEAHDENVQAGLVLRTDPRASIQVARGTAVDYVLSLGPEPTASPVPEPTPLAIPDFTWFTIDDARALADDLGLLLDVRREPTDEVDPGLVLSQDPPPDTERWPGDVVVLVVAELPATVEVPDVRGLSEADAVSSLLDADLRPGMRDEAFDASTEAGRVASSDPRAGLSVARGTMVDYVVSLGPEPTVTPEPTLPQVLVPEFVGLTLVDARSLATEADLVLEVVGRETLDVDPDIVLEQDPAPETPVRAGDRVTITVAVRPVSVPVPNLRGLPEADAVSMLLETALQPGERGERSHATIPLGAVIRSDPAAGTMVALDTVVDYIVSLGPEPSPTPEPSPSPIALPTLVGGTLDDARRFGDETGIVLEVEYLETDRAEPDTILAQDPATGSGVWPGDTVWVQAARAPTTTLVPEVSGLLEPDAVALLIEAGLQPGARSARSSDSVPLGAVIRTDPPSGTTVALGSSVDYFVSRGPRPTASPTPEPTPEPVAAPRLRGLLLPDAQVLADESWLLLQPEYVETADAPPDTVLDQDPGPGVELRRGDQILVTVARPPAMSSVPDVRGFSEADGVAALLDAGFELGSRFERFNDDIPIEAIIRTDPVAETQLAPGSTVDYYVSRGPEPTPTAEPLLVPPLEGLSLDEADARARQAGLRLDVSPEENRDVPPDTVLRQSPAAGSPAVPGQSIRVTVAAAPSTVVVPRLRLMNEEDAVSAILEAGLQPGRRSERYHSDVPADRVVGSEPRAGTEVEPGSAVDYTLSLGPRPVTATPTPAVGPTSEPTDRPNPEPTDRPGPEPTDDGRLDADITAQIAEVVSQVPELRGLEPLGEVPYRTITQKQLRRELRQLFDEEMPAAQVAAEETALKRLGLLPQDADLRALALALYESQVAAFYDTRTGSMTVVQRDDAFDAAERWFIAHEYTHALQDQHFDLEASRVTDSTQGDRALARLSLQEGDAVATMVDWAMRYLSADELAAMGDAVTPQDQALLEDMPLILRRQVEFPYLEGFYFVNSLRGSSWDAVNAAWAKPPASTEQVMHPERYPSDKPVRITLPDIASGLGPGWATGYEQTFGEMQLGVWLGDDTAAAEGWGGDRLVSLEGPGGSWAIAWQTAWDGDGDADEFAAAAERVVAGLPGGGVVLRGADLAGGLPSTALVLIASDRSTLEQVQGSLGVGS